MFVYEIAECEEYPFQISHGLYASKDKALAKAQELCKASYYDRVITDASVVEVDDRSTFVLAGLWTKETFDAWLEANGYSGFWWYSSPFNHHGVFGVFARKVIE